MDCKAEILTLYESGESYGAIAKELSIPKPTVAVVIQSEKIRRGEYLGHIDSDLVRRRYLSEGVDVESIAAEVGLSMAQLKLYTRAMNMKRDPGSVFRVGGKPKPGKGVRVPGSIRDRASLKAKFGSKEHREKMAEAKRGKVRERSNRWKGGHERGGYLQLGGGSNRTYAHRELAESLLGRPLRAEEHVHHIDRDRKNNSPSNLLVLEIKPHMALHVQIRKEPSLDQRKWLKDNGYEFYDLVTYAENSLKKAG